MAGGEGGLGVGGGGARVGEKGLGFIDGGLEFWGGFLPEVSKCLVASVEGIEEAGNYGEFVGFNAVKRQVGEDGG